MFRVLFCFIGVLQVRALLHGGPLWGIPIAVHTYNLEKSSLGVPGQRSKWNLTLRRTNNFYLLRHFPTEIRHTEPSNLLRHTPP
jgi:hypothetical protein